jgi:hypothetical protein
MDPDPDLAPDPAPYVSDLHKPKNSLRIFAYYLLLFEGTFTSLFKDKSHKEVRKQ